MKNKISSSYFLIAKMSVLLLICIQTSIQAEPPQANTPLSQHPFKKDPLHPTTNPSKPPIPPPFIKGKKTVVKEQEDQDEDQEDDKDKNQKQLSKSKSMFDQVPHGQDLVSVDFPNGVNLGDLIKTVGEWTGKNFILGPGVSGSIRVSIVAPDPVTKEQAYEAFLSSLNLAGFTTISTGSIVKIQPIQNAVSSNIKTYFGERWSPATDEVINQVVPLRFVDANSIINQLRNILGSTRASAFTTTNSLILTDTGNRIRRLLEVINLLDDKTNQAQVSIVPINYTDAKDMTNKIIDIFGNRFGSSLTLQKALVDERTNSIILVGPKSGLDDVVRFIQRLDKPSNDQSSQSLIRVRPLDYADAEKLAQTLQALAQNTTSSRMSQMNRPPFSPNYPQPNMPQAQQQNNVVADISGVKVTADKATNSLIIQGSKAAFDEIDNIISQLDRRRPQVYIEANIIDLELDDGFTWTPASIGGANVGGGRYTLPFGFNAAQAIPFANSTQSTSTATSGVPAIAGTSAVLGIISNQTVNIGGYSLSPGALLFALKTNSNNNVLTTPSMMVSDNEDANFQSDYQYSVNVPIANPNGSGTVSQPQKYDVTTALKVTPQISRSGSVNMKINLQLDDAGQVSQEAAYPNPITKRSAESVLTVQDGQTAVLGGITRDSTKRSESKVPLFGDIPIIGWLFKSVINTKQKTNLTLFVTPHIVRDANDLSTIYQKKMDERDEFLKIYYGEKYKEENFYSLLPTREQGMAHKSSSKDQKPSLTEEEKTEETKSSKEKITDSTPRKITLPSKEDKPINAPSSSGGNFGFPNQMPPMAAPMPVPVN